LGANHQAFKGESQRDTLALSRSLFKERQDSCANLNAYIEEQSNHASDMMAKRGDVAAALQSMAGTLFPEGGDVKEKEAVPWALRLCRYRSYRKRR
jgi:hypothetical protein